VPTGVIEDTFLFLSGSRVVECGFSYRGREGMIMLVFWR